MNVYWLSLPIDRVFYAYTSEKFLDIYVWCLLRADLSLSGKTSEHNHR